MITLTLDTIVRGILLKKRYPMHWYLECLTYGKDCLRELHFDDLKVVNTKLLPVLNDTNNVNAVDLPDDYVDYTEVGIKFGQTVKPLVPNDKINSLVNYTSTYGAQPYTNLPTTNSNTGVFGYYLPWYWGMTTINWYGENIGRFFGYGAGVQTDTFKIIKERGQIQLSEWLIGLDNIVLTYISNGMNADAASHIDPYAQATIEEYIYTELKRHNRNYSEGEVQVQEQRYLRQRKLLRARTSSLTIELLTRIVQKNTMAAAKT